jgi:hypothetical protein
MGSEDCGTLTTDSGFRSSADGFAWGFQGGWVETAHRYTKFLLGLQVPDIIKPRLEPSLSDRLHWCGLQGLGYPCKNKFCCSKNDYTRDFQPTTNGQMPAVAASNNGQLA